MGNNKILNLNSTIKNTITVAISVAIAFMLVNILSQSFYSEQPASWSTVLNGIIGGIETSGLYCGIVLATCLPTYALLTFFGCSMIVFIYNVIDMKSFNLAFNSCGINLCIAAVACLFFVIYNKKVNKYKLKQMFNIKKGLIELKPYIKVILYPLFVTAILAIAKSEKMQGYGNMKTSIYLSVTLMISFFLIYALVTLTNMIQDILLAQVVIELYTLVELATHGKADIVVVIELILQSLVLIYVVYNYFVMKKLKQEENVKNAGKLRK